MLLFLAFPLGNHNKVSPGVLPPPQARAGGPPRPASPPQAEVGPAGARGLWGPGVGRAALYPPALLLWMLEELPRGCWEHPEWVAWGSPGIPIPAGSPWPRGAPVAAVATGFALRSDPRAPLCPLSCRGLLLGPAMRNSAPGPPPGTRGAQGRRGGQRGPAACPWQPPLPGPRGRGLLSRDHPHSIPRARHPMSPVPGHRGVRGGGCGLPSQRGGGLHLRPEVSASQAGSALNPSLPSSLARNFSR